MPFKLSKPQSIIWKATEKYRFCCIVAGRRGGKSTIVEKLILRALVKPNQTIWYVSVTYRLTKRLMWRRLKLAIPKDYILHKNETELSIELVNGSFIQLFGADNPDGLVGEGINYCFVDEAGLMKNLEEVVERSLRPALADKEGNLVLVSTPRGFNYYYDLSARSWNFPYSRPDRVTPSNKWWFYSYTTREGGNVSESEMAEIAATMSPKLFDQEMNGTFTTPANRVYEYYDFETNRLTDRELESALASREILVGIDFNVNPMTAVIAVARDQECWIIDSLQIPTSNTEELAVEIKKRYPNHGVVTFPDPAGRARKTSATVGTTDFVILQRAGFQVIAPNKAPLIVDRINAVNSMLCDAKGKRRLLIHGRAKSLIMSLNGQCYKEGTSIPEKGGNPDLSHGADALGYLIYSRFNLFSAQKKDEQRVY